MRVLEAAVLRALTEVRPVGVGLERHLVGAAGHGVHFPLEARHPEAVIGIHREKFQDGPGRVDRVAYGNVQFIGGHYSQ